MKLSVKNHKSPSFKFLQRNSSTGKSGRQEKQAETLKKGQISSSIIVTVTDCSNSMYCTYEHVYVLLYTCDSARMKHMVLLQQEISGIWIKQQHRQRRGRNVLLISSVFSHEPDERKEKEGASPSQEHKEVKRERRRQSHRYWILSVPPKSKNTPTPTLHHSRTLHVHHRIKHIKKYTVLTHVAK